MKFMKVLITGGAGFVGSSLAKAFIENDPRNQITVIDNLKRRGSELNLPIFKKLGIEFHHGDIRNPGDLAALQKNFDFMIEASAEPSVHAGTDGATDYLLDTNLRGSIHCADFAKRACGGMIFLSTSRVYSLKPLQAIPLHENESRLEVPEGTTQAGLTSRGISESFPTNLPRSLYGATKFCSEVLLQEYANTFNMPVVINRCGVLAGPGQFGKVDQGVYTLWVMNHHYQRELKFTGFGGTGKQVRDLLHPRDLFELILKQMNQSKKWQSDIYNVGGGNKVSTSLLEYTELCQDITGKSVKISSQPETAAVDIPYYVTDNSHVEAKFDWKPTTSTKMIVSEIHDWIKKNEETIRILL
jgi:CDP-paratose 2-epimerase